MTNWRSYFGNTPNQSVYAKDAKEGTLGGEQVPFADLHTTFGREKSPNLELVLRGLAIELWSDALGDRFWLVADEEDAAKLGSPRGTVYTAAEARRVIQIGDPAIVLEIHEWKRTFNGGVREVQKRGGGEGRQVLRQSTLSPGKAAERVRE